MGGGVARSAGGERCWQRVPRRQSRVSSSSDRPRRFSPRLRVIGTDRNRVPLLAWHGGTSTTRAGPRDADVQPFTLAGSDRRATDWMTMFDPIGGFLRVRELYITYLETAFRIGDVAVSRERRALLESAGALCTVPLLEPQPRYKSVDWTLRELSSLKGGPLGEFTAEARRAFVSLATAGLF